jgi:hypothetical protein
VAYLATVSRAVALPRDRLIHGHPELEGIRMKRFLLALIIGLLVGYNWGFHDGSNGAPSLGNRIMSKFGADKLRQDQNARDERVRDAASDSSP